MKYEDVKKQLEKIMKLDFNLIEIEKLEDVINNLFLIYKGFINESCDIRSEKEILNDSAETSSKAEKGKIKIEGIQSRLQKDRLISYAYGAYLSNRIAHLFDMKKGVSCALNPIDSSIIVFLDEFNNENNKKNLQKRAFALKAMFMQMVIEQAKDNKRCKLVWGHDEDGRTVLNINITNYSLKKMLEHHNYREDIIISLHVINEELADALQTLCKYKAHRLSGSRPSEVLNGKIYKELQEEEK